MSLQNEPLYFGAESAIGFTACFNISILDDCFVENREDFSFSISTTDPVNLDVSSGHIDILDNDGGYLDYYQCVTCW